MAIRFIIDSASDILPEEAEAMDLIRVPLLVRFGDEEFRDGVDIIPAEFYLRMETSERLPVTSQVPPAVFEEALMPFIESGDPVIIFTLSSALSGTYQSACIAKEALGGPIWVVDTENVTLGERILIERAVKLRDMGMEAKDIAEVINREKKDVRLIASLDQLENLKKGGRISPAVALAGALLGVKPVIGVVDGKIEMIGKARGSKNVNNLLRQLVEKSGGIDFDRPFSLAYSGADRTLLNKYIADSRDLYEGRTERLPVTQVGSVIGTHVGAGAVAFAYFVKKRV